MGRLLGQLGQAGIFAPRLLNPRLGLALLGAPRRPLHQQRGVAGHAGGPAADPAQRDHAALGDAGAAQRRSLGGRTQRRADCGGDAVRLGHRLVPTKFRQPVGDRGRVARAQQPQHIFLAKQARQVARTQQQRIAGPQQRAIEFRLNR